MNVLKCAHVTNTCTCSYMLFFSSMLLLQTVEKCFYCMLTAEDQRWNRLMVHLIELKNGGPQNTSTFCSKNASCSWKTLSKPSCNQAFQKWELFLQTCLAFFKATTIGRFSKVLVKFVWNYKDNAIKMFIVVWIN